MGKINVVDDQIRASSFFDRENESHGKQHLVDGKACTFWQSDHVNFLQVFVARIQLQPGHFMQGQSQWLLVKFPNEIRLDEIRIQFKQGMPAQTVVVRDMDKKKDLETFWPDDNESVQTLALPPNTTVREIKITLDTKDGTYMNGTYGKVAVQSLEFFGG